MADVLATRSRGGFVSKFHLVTVGRGTLLIVEVPAGQVHESTQVESAMEGIAIPQRVGLAWQRVRLVAYLPKGNIRRNRKPERSTDTCPYCKSINVAVLAEHIDHQADRVELDCKCRSCGTVWAVAHSVREHNETKAFEREQTDYLRRDGRTMSGSSRVIVPKMTKLGTFGGVSCKQKPI